MPHVHLGLRDVLTAVALVVSLLALFRSYRQDKRDLFLRMHTDLLDEVPMRGRRVLGGIRNEAHAQQAVLDQDAQTAVYRALALFDVLGLYVEQGWADRWTVLDEWANSLSAYREPKRLWANVRWPHDNKPRWPHYDRLATQAARYVADGRPSWVGRKRLDLRDMLRRARHRLR